MPAFQPTLRLSLLAALGLVMGASVAASPCAAPASYVKAPDAARAPLLRPYVLGGLAATALHQRGDERWLELAAPSVATAERALASVKGLAGTPRLSAEGGSVLVACSSLGSSDLRVAQQPSSTVATPLW